VRDVIEETLGKGGAESFTPSVNHVLMVSVVIVLLAIFYQVSKGGIERERIG
jgi:hypothetical protein